MQKKILILTGLFGILAVALGAFAAHGLHDFLEKNEVLKTFETAVRYHFYHTFALFGVGILLFKIESKLLYWAGKLFALGIILFSGSLYALCFTGIKPLGIITPFGGLAFIIAWFLVAWSVYKSE